MIRYMIVICLMSLIGPALASANQNVPSAMDQLRQAAPAGTPIPAPRVLAVRIAETPPPPSWRLAISMMQDTFSEYARTSSNKRVFLSLAESQFPIILQAWPHHEAVILGYKRLLQALDRKYSEDAAFLASVRWDQVGIKALAAQYEEAPEFLKALDRLINKIHAEP